jgi:hypothetical protein
MSNKSNNRTRTTRITVRFYAPDCRAPRTFAQEVRELAPAFGIAFLFAGALVACACAFAAIVNAVG